MGEPNEQWATTHDMREWGSAIIEQMDRRFRESRERGDEKHDENKEFQVAILAEAKKTNGRITTLEVETRTLKDEFQGIRKRWHDFRDSVQARLHGAQGPQGPQGIQGVQGASGENRHVTMRDVYMFCGGAGIIWALAKTMKWIP